MGGPLAPEEVGAGGVGRLAAEEGAGGVGRLAAEEVEGLAGSRDTARLAASLELGAESLAGSRDTERAGGDADSPDDGVVDASGFAGSRATDWPGVSGGGPDQGTRDSTPGTGSGGPPSGPRGPGSGEPATDCSGAGSAGGSGAGWLVRSDDGHREDPCSGMRASRRAAAVSGAWLPGSPGESSSEASLAPDEPDAPVSAGGPAAPPGVPPAAGLRESRCTPVPASRCSFSWGIGPLPVPSTIAAPRPYSVAPRALRYSRCLSFHWSSVYRWTWGANGTPIDSAFF